MEAEGYRFVIEGFVQERAAGRSVFVSEVREALRSISSERLECVLVLPDARSRIRFEIPLPETNDWSDPSMRLVSEYVLAEVYNHLVMLGGHSLDIYADTSRAWIVELVARVVERFQLDRSRSDRCGYGRIVNMLERMNEALHAGALPGGSRFEITVRDLAHRVGDVASVTFSARPTRALRSAPGRLEGRAVCGLDVGGTSIKAVLSLNGRISAFKEYDWNPAGYANVEQILDPILAIVRLLRARASVARECPGGSATPAGQRCKDTVERAFRADASLEEMTDAAELVETARGSDLRPLDGVGFSFPDVVVRNRIVGGEVPKTRAMRENPRRDFEAQFSRLSLLSDRLRCFCGAGGVVKGVNDGPMAAFSAAVEIAASPHAEARARGVFAHSLGTDLGTGLVLADGSIPEIPLEAYNMVIDLGDEAARRLPADDLRSLRNWNTGVPGTPQKLMGQGGLFRLADSILTDRRPDLVERFRQSGYLVDRSDGARVVPDSPNDMRKPYLAELMQLARTDDDVAELFRKAGEALAEVYRESERILGTGLRKRILFGGFVMVDRVYELLCEGAARRERDLELVAIGGDTAFTPLMRELEADPDHTVAKFGQAVGAVHFAGLGLRPREA